MKQIKPNIDTVGDKPLALRVKRPRCRVGLYARRLVLFAYTPHASRIRLHRRSGWERGELPDSFALPISGQTCFR